MKTQSGFTLIEMVAVIIILAIMAATAMPRFTSLTGEARLSALQGVQGALSAARDLAKSKWVAANSSNLSTIDMGGTFISVISGAGNANGTAAQGYPVVTGGPISGMWNAMDTPNGFSSALNVSGLVIWPTGVANSAVCNVWYSAGVITISATVAANCL